MSIVDDTEASRRSFFANVTVKDGCWEWHGTTRRWGYGSFNFGGQQMSAHRFSWTIHNGAIPAGMNVCHHCDNPGCTNPQHLFIGTQRDNMRDMTAKGRHAPCRIPLTAKAHGERHPKAKLKVSDVAAIRAASAAGATRVAVARAYGIHPATVHQIVHRRIWRHV